MEEFVMINGLHSYNDLNLILKKKTISQPEIKGNIIKIPGSDKVINLLKAVSGRTNYGTRKITMEFQMIDIKGTFPETYSRVAEICHGEACRIIFSSDPSFYYAGTGTVSKGDKEGRIGNIIIEITAEPYKYDIRATDERIEWDTFNFDSGIYQELVDIEVQETGTEVMVIGRKRASVPEIYAENDGTVAFKGLEYALTRGWNKIPDIVIGQGENTLLFKRTGIVTIRYRGGCL